MIFLLAESVIIARILRQRNDAATQRITYKIAVKKAYKMNESASRYLSDGKLHTAASESMCGQPLHIGKLYVIAGRSAHISLCSYARPYAHMTVVERRGFAGGYRKGCACDIRMTFGGDAGALPVPGECNWSPWDDCETALGACVPSRGGFNETVRPIKCHWRSTPLYNECVNEP